MVLGVANHQTVMSHIVPKVSHALSMKEFSFAESAIFEADLASADCLQTSHCFHVNEDKPIVG